MTYREITFAENQKIADRLLQQCRIKANSGLPVNPEIVLREKGHSLIPMPNMKRLYGVVGCVVKWGAVLQVYIDEYYYSHESERSLFTIGEELGHIYLHLLDLRSVESVADWIQVLSSTGKYHKMIESQVRLFASNLLLPHFIFDGYVMEWVGKNLDQLAAFPRISPATLADNISLFLEDELRISQSILSITLQRWPNPLINQAIKQHPGLLSDYEGGN